MGGSTNDDAIGRRNAECAQQENIEHFAVGIYFLCHSLVHNILSQNKGI